MAARAASLPPPEMRRLEQSFNLLVTGVGGTGVITVGALISMAAHLEERAVSVLDSTGFSPGCTRIGALPTSSRQTFEGVFKINYHLAPPFLPAEKDARGRPRKRSFGPWLRTPLQILVRLKNLRGTPFDVFGYSAERRMERDLIG